MHSPCSVRGDTAALAAVATAFGCIRWLYDLKRLE